MVMQILEGKNYKNYFGDNVEIMKGFDEGIVDLTVTSPPYDDLRTYDNQIDKSWNQETWENVLDELYRITKPGGIVVWVVGDAVIDGSESGTSFKQALYAKEIGFNIHDTMIYEKNGSSFPASKKSTRYSQVFEYMFIFSKGKPKTANLLFDRKNRWAGSKNFGKTSSRGKDGERKSSDSFTVAEYGARFNIWKYNTGRGYSTKDEIAYKHPAIFPEKLVEDHIITWSNEGDLVFDPFLGSGTTGKVAIQLNRKFIGTELNKEYFDIAETRMSQFVPLEEW
jgi:site-specific DNA-methyltransferase (adenine-specific)